MSHLCNAHCRLFKGVHAEEVARFERQLTAYYLLIYTGVTINLDFVDAGLNTLRDADFEVNGVTVHIHFHFLHSVEHVTLVEVAVGNRLVVRVQTFSNVRLVIDITSLHLQHSVEVFRLIERVAHPVDIADIVLVALVDMEENIHQIITHIDHAVGIDIGITITEFVVLLDDAVFVLFKLLSNKLLGFEETLEALLVGLLQETA